MRSHGMTEATMKSHTEAQAIDSVDTRFENLSALTDGELPDALAQQIIKQLSRNQAERARHSEYLAIGDAMRGLSEQHVDFTQRVMTALEKEPVLLAPVVKKSERRPLLWLAAASAAAITWGIWQSNPRDEIAPQMATAQPPANQAIEAMPYLNAHQDFAQAVIATQEMRFSKASLEIRQ